MNEHQQLTRYIKHLAESANFKAVTFNKNRSGLTGLLSEMPNVSYTHPLKPHIAKSLEKPIVRPKFVNKNALSTLTEKLTKFNETEGMKKAQPITKAIKFTMY